MLGCQVSKWLVNGCKWCITYLNGVYWGYNPFTNQLLTSCNIQVVVRWPHLVIFCFDLTEVYQPGWDWKNHPASFFVGFGWFRYIFRGLLLLNFRSAIQRNVPHHFTRWWCQTCCIFTLSWGNDPVWRPYVWIGLVQPPPRNLLNFIRHTLWVAQLGNYIDSKPRGKVKPLFNGVSIFLRSHPQGALEDTPDVSPAVYVSEFLSLLGFGEVWGIFPGYVGKIIEYWMFNGVDFPCFFGRLWRMQINHKFFTTNQPCEYVNVHRRNMCRWQ